MLNKEQLKAMDTTELWDYTLATVQGVATGLGIVCESDEVGRGGHFLGDAGWRLDGVTECLFELSDRYRGIQVNAPDTLKAVAS